MADDFCKEFSWQQVKYIEGLAERGKFSMEWFFRLKLHLIINDNTLPTLPPTWERAKKARKGSEKPAEK